MHNDWLARNNLPSSLHGSITGHQNECCDQQKRDSFSWDTKQLNQIIEWILYECEKP
jgi:hypothetical protein